MHNEFINPYKDVPEENLVRLQSLVLDSDYTYPQSLRLRKGTVNTTINILFQKLVAECKRRGFVDITDREKFESFIVNCTIVLPTEVDMLAYNGIVKTATPSNRKKK